MNRALTSVLGLAILAGGLQLYSAPRPNTITVAGPNDMGAGPLPTGIAWGVTVCPANGAVASTLAFIAQGNTLNGAGSSATAVIENHTTTTTMCSVTVPCTISVGATVSANCNSGLTCAPGDTIHIEWESSSCLLGAYPKGAGSGTLQEL